MTIVDQEMLLLMSLENAIDALLSSMEAAALLKRWAYVSQLHAALITAVEVIENVTGADGTPVATRQ